MMKRIGVSGSSGFLGRHVLAQQSSELAFMSIKREDSVLGAGPSFDAIILCHGVVASGNDALSELDLFSGNVEFTQKLLENCVCRRAVYASTASIAGFQSQPVLESSLVNPPNMYAISKLWGEALIKQKPSYAIVRFSSIYGPGMRENTIIPNYVNQALNKGEIEVWGNGSRKQNYIHVLDSARIMLAAAQSSENRIFLGVDTCEYTNLELAEIIASITAAKIKYVNSDVSLSVSYDNAKTRTMLNWKPAISFEAGIGQYIEWKKRQLS